VITKSRVRDFFVFNYESGTFVTARCKVRNKSDYLLYKSVLLTSVFRAFFKHFKSSNYSLKMLKFSIFIALDFSKKIKNFNALITQTFIKSYNLKFLTRAPRTLVNISLY